jgi:hypothetical protein
MQGDLCHDVPEVAKVEPVWGFGVADDVAALLLLLLLLHAGPAICSAVSRRRAAQSFMCDLQ